MDNENEMNTTEESLQVAFKNAIMESLEVYESQRSGSDERKTEAENVRTLVNSYSDLIKSREEITDKIERRQIEAEKNRNYAELEEKKYELEAKKTDINAEIEAEKARIPWERILVETAASFGRQITDHVFFGIRQREVLQFEETGVVRSKAGRELSFRFPWSKK